MIRCTLFILCLVSGLHEIKASCSSHYLSVFPWHDTVPKNSLFLIEGYAQSQQVITGLNKQYPVYLEAGDKKINLLVKEILVGGFQLTQALMRPEFPLEAGVTYTLKIDNLPSYEHLMKYDNATRQYKPLTYVASAFIDSVSPAVQRNPTEIRKSFIAYGCGPAKNVVFDCPATDSSSLLVRTTVKDIASGKSTTYILTPRAKEIHIGHGMCSGEFAFNGGDKYEVTFIFMDVCGNFAKATPPVQITEPVPGDGRD